MVVGFLKGEECVGGDSCRRKRFRELPVVNPYVRSLVLECDLLFHSI